MPPSEPPMPFVKPDLAAVAAAVPPHLSHLPGGALKRWQDRAKPQLHARAYLRLGLYQWHIHDAGLDGATIQRCLGLLKVGVGGGWSCWRGLLDGWVLDGCAACFYIQPTQPFLYANDDKPSPPQKINSPPPSMAPTGPRRGTTGRSSTAASWSRWRGRGSPRRRRSTWRRRCRGSSGGGSRVGACGAGGGDDVCFVGLVFVGCGQGWCIVCVMTPADSAPRWHASEFTPTPPTCYRQSPRPTSSPPNNPHPHPPPTPTRRQRRPGPGRRRPHRRAAGHPAAADALVQLVGFRRDDARAVQRVVVMAWWIIVRPDDRGPAKFGTKSPTENE
jgi:hypothetical protein